VGGLVLPERQRRLGREQLGDDRGGVAALDTPVARRPDYTPDAPVARPTPRKVACTTCQTRAGETTLVG